ncbi:Wall-associated receptor kinase 2 [Vitis vinifera]|uniref:Wall-associated receptor kinase 2 n=1 Tax=Vitis vinifera TaxID=29760 RepID=A0A438HAQ8_VITVI|nr:Wall-associated receptor kinase 2 [Vitis vinifera]
MITIISLLFSLKETAASMAKPGCPETCGNVSIVYPFGIGKGCYLDKRFEITCNNSSLPHPIFHLGEENEAEVLHVSGLFYTENKFISIGCDTFAYIGDSNTTNSIVKNYISGCVSVCNGQGWSWLDTNYSCSGIGCCQTTFPEDLSIFEIRIGNMSTWADGGDWPSNQCSLILIAEKNFSEFRQFDVSFSNVNKTYFYPSVLNWAIGNKSCHEARKRGDYACASNSRCVNSKKGSGYTCQCNSGYRGNPYLPDGCVDVDECMETNNTLCKKGAFCINTNGSYYCNCPHGYLYRIDDKHEYECARNNKGKLKAAILVSSGMKLSHCLPHVQRLLSLGFVVTWVAYTCRNRNRSCSYHPTCYWLLVDLELEKRKKNKLRQKFFKKNGGLLLKQQISSTSKGGVEKTKLYTIEELEKATDNFNAGRVLGKGGHGKVYKGMLLDGSIVAIKKSIIVEERQVVEFVYEVFILCQINHRHIVKLLAIFHRDVKSMNILLDENFRAVISDFGLSRSIAHEKTHLSTLVQGTFGYLDPEYFRSGQFTDKSDVHGFGIILAELLTGEKVICSSRSEESLAIHFRLAMKQNFLFEILDKVIVNEGQEKEILAVAKIAKRCLKLSGKKRPAMKEIAADLNQLRRTMKQPSLKQTCQDNCPVSGRYSFSSASTSAVTEEYALQG